MQFLPLLQPVQRHIQPPLPFPFALLLGFTHLRQKAHVALEVTLFSSFCSFCSRISFKFYKTFNSSNFHLNQCYIHHIIILCHIYYMYICEFMLNHVNSLSKMSVPSEKGLALHLPEVRRLAMLLQPLFQLLQGGGHVRGVHRRHDAQLLKEPEA